MFYATLRPLLFRLDAERAHDWTFALFDAAERLGLTRLTAPNLPLVPVRAMGLTFPNPVGLAAGLDKNGEHIDALATLGFGFIEVGTVTARPQPGNLRPRLFRIPQVQALVNRMGFNNLGLDRLVHNVGRARYRGILGINIGKNADTPIERAAVDYLACMRKAYPLASYLAVNISSPNTKDLRQLQQSNELDRLLAILKAEQQALSRAHRRYVPLVVKIAPDLADEEIDTIARLLVEHGVDGVIATNTTISRSGVEGLPQGEQAGGMSGGPLRQRSTAVVRRLYASLGEQVPIVGVGGILCAEDALEKIAAGAKLIQLYSGLVYVGPGLVGRCVRAIGRR